MIDQLIRLVRDEGKEIIDNNPAIPEKSRNDAATVIAQEIFGGLQEQAKAGNMNAIAAMLNNNPPNLEDDPIVTQMISNIAGKFSGKFGIPPNTGRSLLQHTVPAIIRRFVARTSDPDDPEFDFQEVLRNFTGKNNIGDILSEFNN
jgi:hypothetical protein